LRLKSCNASPRRGIRFSPSNVGSVAAALNQAGEDQRGAGDVRRGDLDLDVAGADAFETLAEHAAGDLGAVAVAAQVAEVQVPQAGRGHLLDRVGGGIVGKMSVAAKDSLFEAPRPPGIVLEQFDVVVGFQEQGVGVAHAFDNEFGDIAEIGDKAEVARGSAQQESDGILGIVGHGEGFDDDVAHLEGGAGLEEAAIQRRLAIDFEGFLGLAITKEGDAQFGGDDGEALGVVGMLVRQQDAGQSLRGPADAGQALTNLTTAQSRIDQDAGFIGFQVGAIAAGTAPENRKLHRHRDKLGIGERAGND
jgi:hypothetical protein